MGPFIQHGDSRSALGLGLQATLSAVYSTSAPTSFTTSDSLAQRLNQAPPPMNEVNTSATEGPTKGPTYEGGSSGDTPSPTTGNFNTAAPTQELTPTPSAPSSASSGTCTRAVAGHNSLPACMLHCCFDEGHESCSCCLYV